MGQPKERIYKLHPKLLIEAKSSEGFKKQFGEAIEGAWDDLGDDYFDKLIHFMDSRVNAALAAKG